LCLLYTYWLGLYIIIYSLDYEGKLIIRVYLSAVWLQNSTRKTNDMGAAQL